MSKSTIGRRRAGLATIATSALVMGACLVAAPAQADWAATGGEIGLVDTDKTTAGTQGATLVYPGTANQKLGDVRLLIPNSFQNGDTIDLVLFDRSADATAPDATPGQINADAAHRVGFNSVPTVTVNPTPHAPSNSIGPTSGAGVGTGNTEGTTALGNAPVPDTTAPIATQPPVFAASLVQSSRANGLANDIIRLRVNGVQASAGDSEWVVTLSGLNVDLGAAVSPGELRVVPFAYNGTPAQTGTNASLLFGTRPDVDNNPTTFDPLIGTYTVPAYVAPVTFSVGTPNNVLADGTPQRVGDITISETNNYSLQAGTYTVTISGATIRNDATSPVTISKTGGGTGAGEDTVTLGAVTPNTITFTLAADSDTTKLSVLLKGLLLSSTTQGPITYTLSGGSVDQFMFNPAGSSPAIGTPGATPGVTGVRSDAEFSPNVNQDDIRPPAFQVSSISTPLESRIGGADRYETAAKIARNLTSDSDYAIVASGQNFPDALSANYMSAIFGAPILLTRQNSVPQVTKLALRQLGVSTVFIVGGPAAVSNGVETDLDDETVYFPGGEVTFGNANMDIVRVAGDDRYQTNRKANEYAAANWQGANPVGRTQPEFGKPSKLTALVATGEDFADALSSGPATWGVQDTFGPVSGGLPLLLTRSASLSPTASSQMQNFGIEHAVIVGGPSAISAGVESAITAAGASTARLAGANRYDTATKVATWITTPGAATSTRGGGLGFDDVDAANDELAFLATGEKFADALAGGPLGGARMSPVLLTRTATLAPETQAWLSGKAAEYGAVTALGLGAAVAPSVLDAANAAISAQ